MEGNQPGYYAIIPADVRYDESIPANAKLLYGEISALIGAEGFCFASNDYLASRFKMTHEAIARLITKLEKAGHIQRVIEKDAAGQITARKIYLRVSIPDGWGIDQKINTPQPKNQGGIDQKVKYTNTSIYNKKENIKRKVPNENFDPLPLFVSWIDKVFQEHPPEGKNALYQALVRFSENRTTLKKPMKSQASVTALCNRLCRLTQHDQFPLASMIDLLDTATASGWQSVYAPQSAKPVSARSSGEVVYKDI